MTCRAPIRVEAERQPIIRTPWRCFVWCTAAKELHSLLRTIPREFCDHKSTLPPDSPGNRLLDVRQQLCCRLTKEQKWQLLFDRNWGSLAPGSQTKWLVYLRKWKVTISCPRASLQSHTDWGLLDLSAVSQRPPCFVNRQFSVANALARRPLTT